MQSPGTFIVRIYNATKKKATFYCSNTVAAYKTPPEGQPIIIGKMLGSTPTPPVRLYSNGFTWVLLSLFPLPDCLVCSPRVCLSLVLSMFCLLLQKGASLPTNPLFSLYVYFRHHSLFLKPSDGNFSILWVTRNSF